MAERQLYSVFVGHLTPEITKAELYELFSKYGDIGSLSIVDTEKPLKFGFVRYRECAAVYRAKAELNRYMFKGNSIYVDISKDTADRIEKEKKEIAQTAADPMIKRDDSEPNMKSRAYISDIMYLSKVKEKCAALNYEGSKLASKGDGRLQQLDIDEVLEHLGQTEKLRPKTIRGQISEIPSIERIKEKLLQSDDVSADKTKERAEKFMSVLGDVMETISTFLSKVTNESKNDIKAAPTKEIVYTADNSLREGNLEFVKRQQRLSLSDSGTFSASDSGVFDGIMCKSDDRQKMHVSARTDTKSVKSSSYRANFHVDSSSDTGMSDDGDNPANIDSGVELDRFTLKPTTKKFLAKGNNSILKGDNLVLKGDNSPIRGDSFFLGDDSCTKDSSDKMPPLECIQELKFSSKSSLSDENELESDLSCMNIGAVYQSDRQSEESGSELKPSLQEKMLKRQNKSDGDLLTMRQNAMKFEAGTSDDSLTTTQNAMKFQDNNSDDSLRQNAMKYEDATSDNHNEHFVDWFVSKLKNSKMGQEMSDLNEDDGVNSESATPSVKETDNEVTAGSVTSSNSESDKGATGGMSEQEKLASSEQLQNYYFKAILGRGRGLNSTPQQRQQNQSFWIRGGRWGRGHI